MEKKSLSILGCGWLGKAVGAHFVRKGWNVLGSTTSAEKMPAIAAIGIVPRLIQLNPAPVGEGLHGFFETDVLIISLPPKRKTGLADVFLQQIASLTDVIAHASVKRVIFISATSVYANLNREVFEHDADPSSLLVAAENSLINNKSYKTTVLRFGGLVGPGRHPGRFLSGKENIEGADIPVNIIHQQDCVKIIDKVISQNFFGEVFNACADEHPTKRDFYERASDALNLPKPRFKTETNVSYKIVCSQKLKQLLNYQFHYPDPMTMIS